MTAPADPLELSEELNCRGLTIPIEQIHLLDRYRRLLLNWNQRLNLTRHTDTGTFVGRDVLDSMQLADQLSEGERVLDVGTGGGVPGVILGILRPDLDVSVCESIGKKASAVDAMGKELELPIAVYDLRVQELLPQRTFDTLVARAVGPLWRVLSWLDPHWSQFERLLLIKGPRWVDERAEARHRGSLRELNLRRVASYTAPAHDRPSVILSLTSSRKGST